MHCTQVGMGSNPIADMSCQCNHVGSREGVLQHFCVVLDTHRGCMSDRGRAGCLKGALCSFVCTLGGRVPGCSW